MFKIGWRHWPAKRGKEYEAYRKAASKVTRGHTRRKEMKKALVVMLFSFITVGRGQGQDKPTQPTGPSYDDTVKWIQNHISEAGVPGYTEQSQGLVPEEVRPCIKNGKDENGEPCGSVANQPVTLTVDDQKFAITVNGCSTLHLIITSHVHGTNPNPQREETHNHPPSGDWSRTADFSIPLIDLLVTTSTHVPTDMMSAGTKDWYSNAAVPSVALVWSMGHPATWIWTNKGDGLFVDFNGSMPPKRLDFAPSDVDEQTRRRFVWEDSVTGAVRAGVYLSYGMPGADDPSHMASALKHLKDVCKANPDAAPKDIF
jgi:hypothetical protein